MHHDGRETRSARENRSRKTRAAHGGVRTTWQGVAVNIVLCIVHSVSNTLSRPVMLENQNCDPC